MGPGADCGDAIGKGQLCINSPPYGVTLSTRDSSQQPDVGKRRNLHNTKCLYYSRPGGCTNPYCRFLHDEEPTPVVFCGMADEPQEHCYMSGYYIEVLTHPHIKVEDARIFFGNLPPPYGEDFIRSIVEPHGEIKYIDIWGTTLINRHRSGFVHMKSVEAAKSAIIDINHTLVGDAQLYANMKSSDVYWKRLPGWNPYISYIPPKHDDLREMPADKMHPRGAAAMVLGLE